MKRIQICQAEPGGSEVVPVIIEISGSLLGIYEISTLDEHRAVFLREAALIDQALINALPGGTYDQLCGLMLKRKSSHFVVRHAL